MNGISAIICTQNDEKTIEHSLISFAKFADETIVVVNNSSDKTWEIVETCRLEHPAFKIVTIKLDGTRDLSEARQVGYAASKYNWLIRADGDFICYTELDGKFSPHIFKKRLLNTKIKYPTVYYVPQLNVFHDFNMVGDGSYAFLPFDEPLMPRIYSRSMFLKFERLGRNEGVPYIFFYRKKYLHTPLWLHATIKNPVEVRLSHSWRRDWRELGNYEKYPTLMDYVKAVKLPECYPGLSLNQASEKFYNERVLPSLSLLPKDSKWPVPKHLKLET